MAASLTAEHGTFRSLRERTITPILSLVSSGRGPSSRWSTPLPKNDLLQIDVPAGTQPCETFGMHPSLKFTKGLYDQGDAAWIANIGAMVEPVTKAEYKAEKRGQNGLKTSIATISELEKAYKRMYKRQYLAFRHDGAHKKEKKSVFATEDDGLFDYERRIPRR